MARFQDIFRKWMQRMQISHVFKLSNTAKTLFVHIWIFKQSLHAPIFFDWIFFCRILSSIQIKCYLEQPDLKCPKFHEFLPKEKYGGCHMFSQFCHLLYPNGIVAVSFFKLLLSLHIGGCHRNGRALCFS